MTGRRGAVAWLAAVAIGVAGIAATLDLAGCISLLGPRTVDVSQARLQELVDARFPVKRRLFDAIDVMLGSPRITLQPDANRIAVEVTVGAGNDEGAVRTAMSGSLVVSEGLRFEPSDNTVRLVDVRIEHFAIDGLPASWQRQLERLGKPLAKSLLDDQVLYALRPKDIAGLEGRGLRPAELRVTATGLRITLVPFGH